MLDSKKLRKETELVIQNLSRRGFNFDLKKWENLELQRKELQAFNENQQSKLNDICKEIGIAKKELKDTSKLQKEASKLTAEIKNQTKQDCIEAKQSYIETKQNYLKTEQHQSQLYQNTAKPNKTKSKY